MQKLSWLWFGLCSLLVVVLYAAFLAPASDFYLLSDDQALYLAGAKSLASGMGFRNISRADNPWFDAYPIGYPFTIAPAFLVSAGIHTQMLIARVITSLSAFLAFLLVFRYLRRHLPWYLALLFIVSFAISPAFYGVATDLYSEPLFIILVTLAALLLESKPVSSSSQAKPVPLGWKRLCLVGLLLALACMTRSIGIFLVAGMVLSYLCQRRWSETLTFGGSFLVSFSPWLLWTRLHKSDASNRYINEFLTTASWQISLSNVQDVIGHNLPVMVFPILESRAFLTLSHNPLVGALTYLLGTVIILSTIVGWILQVRKGNVIAAGLLSYTAFAIIWPFYPLRYLLPAFPFFFVYAVQGVHWLVSRLGKRKEANNDVLTRRVHIALAALLALNIVLALSVDARSLKNLYRSGHYAGSEPAATWQRYRAGLDWLKQNTPANAVVLSGNPETVYLYSDRKTQRSWTPAEVEQAVAKYGTQNPVYFFAAKRNSAMPATLGQEFGLAPVQQFGLRHPGTLREVWKDGTGELFIYQYQPE